MACVFNTVVLDLTAGITVSFEGRGLIREAGLIGVFTRYTAHVPICIALIAIPFTAPIVMTRTDAGPREMPTCCVSAGFGNICTYAFGILLRHFTCIRDNFKGNLQAKKRRTPCWQRITTGFLAGISANPSGDNSRDD